MNLDDVMNWILAAGALGTAAFGFVEALAAKDKIGLAGLRQLRRALELPGDGVLMRLLSKVYGAEEFDALLKATYRRGPADTSEFLRNGLRLAMADNVDEDDRARAARVLGQDPGAVRVAYDAVRRASADEPAPDAPLAQRKTIGQTELVIDARVEAAVCYADAILAGRKRWIAAVFAVCASLIVTFLNEPESLCTCKDFFTALGHGLPIGIAAVPFAPIAKDLVSLLQSARDALRVRAT